LDILIAIGLVVILLAALFFIPSWLLKRAVRQVIKIFRRHNAVDATTAMSDSELGLRPLPLLRRLMQRRDYKPDALNVMIRAGVVLMTDEGKLYLSEEKLASSNLSKLG
jgi:hypothetical protein